MDEIAGDDGAIGGEGLKGESAEHGGRGHLEFDDVSWGDLAMWKWNGDTATGEIAVKVAASVDAAEMPAEGNGGVAFGGEMGGGDLETDAGIGREFLDGRRVDGEGIALVDDAGIVAELFWCAVVVEEAIVLPFDVVEFGIDVGGDLLMAAEFVGEEFEAPTDVAISIKSADAAVLAIDEWLAFVKEPGNVVERGTDEGGGDDIIDVGFGFLIIVDVEVPGVNVGVTMLVILEVFPVADAHVFDEASGVEVFGEFPHAMDPDLGDGEGGGSGLVDRWIVGGMDCWIGGFVE
jgi:hypothetical protein